MVRTDCCWNQCDWVTYLIILFGAIRTTGASFGFCNQIRDAEIRGMPDLHPEGPGTAPAKFRLRSWRDLGGFLAAEIAEISPRFRQDLKILAAKNSLRFSARSQNLVEILAKILARSPNLSGQKLAEISKSRRDSRWDLGEISGSRRPKTRRDSHRDLKISAAKNSPRISARSQVRSRWDLKVSAVKNLLRISTRLVKISKSWRPKHLTEKTGRYFKMSTLRSR